MSRLRSLISMKRDNKLLQLRIKLEKNSNNPAESRKSKNPICVIHIKIN